jgi:hypothetical protein
MTSGSSIAARDMDLLDYFAAKAMGQLIDKSYKKDLDPDTLAVDSYMIAEAMMRERNRDYSKDD